jgi:hypothetical protein
MQAATPEATAVMVYQIVLQARPLLTLVAAEEHPQMDPTAQEAQAAAAAQVAAEQQAQSTQAAAQAQQAEAAEQARQAAPAS